MVSSLNNSQMAKMNLGLAEKKKNTSAEKQQPKVYEHDEIMENSLKNRVKIGATNLKNAFITYPVKGIKGDRHSNFHEFLTMGDAAFLIGSASLMAVFGLCNKYFNNFSKHKAGKASFGFAVGVGLYGLAKSLNNEFINKAVKATTGVDLGMPYKRVIHGFPEKEGAPEPIFYEYHKVFESKEFPRTDLLDSKGENFNEYYDKIAPKMNLGDNLTASKSEVVPRIKELISTAGAAKYVSSALFAATGVGLATQYDAWGRVLNHLKDANVQNAPMMTRVKEFGRALGGAIKDSAVSLWKGNPASKANQIAGKALILVPIATTLLTTANAILKAKRKPNLANENVIDQNKKIVRG